jgi:hypothetical protein
MQICKQLLNSSPSHRHFPSPTTWSEYIEASQHQAWITPSVSGRDGVFISDSKQVQRLLWAKHIGSLCRSLAITSVNFFWLLKPWRLARYSHSSL